MSRGSFLVRYFPDESECPVSSLTHLSRVDTYSLFEWFHGTVVLRDLSVRDTTVLFSRWPVEYGRLKQPFDWKRYGPLRWVPLRQSDPLTYTLNDDFEESSTHGNSQGDQGRTISSFGVSRVIWVVLCGEEVPGRSERWLFQIVIDRSLFEGHSVCPVTFYTNLDFTFFYWPWV